MHRDFDEGHARLPGWVYDLRDRVAILERRTEYLMAQENDTQAQADELGNILTALTTDWNTKAAEIATLEETIKTLQSQQAAGTPVDLSGLLTQATALRTSMEASEAAAAATQATAPAGDQTGGGTGGATAGADAGSGTAADQSGSTAGADAGTGTTAAPADGSQTADATA